MKGITVEIVIALFLFALYLLPTLVANHRDIHAVAGIALLNIFFGWTVLGWFGALIWAVSARQD
jgi:hypothetical protein